MALPREGKYGAGKMLTEPLHDKDVLTTGDVARICNVASRTVSKWFDSGQLRGYRIPGSTGFRLAVAGAGLIIAIPLLDSIYTQRLFTITMDSASAFGLLFIGVVFCYYWYHRTAHRVRWFWATHAVHHSPNQLSLATAVRLGATGKLTVTTLFFAPLIWLGFPPLAVFATLAVNLLNAVGSSVACIAGSFAGFALGRIFGA